ncbi:MAG: hypothetical protein QXR97_04680 [Thermoproteota archaeon]
MPPEVTESEHGVRIRRGEVEIEVWGSREFVESTLEKLKEEFFKKVETPVAQAVKPPSASMTFTEYLAEEAKALGREPDTLKGYEKILLIGYYIYTTENRDFTYEDIERLKTEARLSGLENPRQYMGVLIRKGYVSETGTEEGGKKVFRMLRRGLQYVESGFREAEA